MPARLIVSGFRYKGTPSSFFAFLTNGSIFITSCLLPRRRNRLKMEAQLKGKKRKEYTPSEQSRVFKS